MRINVRLLACVGALAVSILGGCEPHAASPSGTGRLFGVSLQTMGNPFFVELNNGLKARIEGQGDRLVTLDAQFNSQKQKNDIAGLLRQQPAAIFITPVNWEGIKEILIEAKRKHVPVLVVDTAVSEPELALCQVGSDNVEAGRLACEALAQVRPQAKVVILHRSVSKSCIDRVAGFKAEMAKYPGMEILDIQEGGGTFEGARPVMRDLLARFPELDAAFPINDLSALGAISAIESAGRNGQVTVVTVDGSREGATAILAGKLYATVAQYPREIGRLAAENAYASIAGQPVEKDLTVPVKLFTKKNAASLLEPK